MERNYVIGVDKGEAAETYLLAFEKTAKGTALQQVRRLGGKSAFRMLGKRKLSTMVRELTRR